MEGFREMIRAFDGTNGDVDTWLNKLKLVAKLKKITALHEFLPLYLEGSAFAVYDHLSTEAKADADKIQTALRSAFPCDRYKAYNLFCSRSMQNGMSL